MTREQLHRAVTDVTAALRPHCLADDVAGERARNMVQALAFADARTFDDRQMIAARVLLTRCHEIQRFWRAVRDVTEAFARVADGDSAAAEVAS